MLIVWQSKTLTCVGRVWYQAYIRTGHLGIYLVFMNIFTHSKLSGLISNHRKLCSSNHLFCTALMTAVGQICI